MTEQKHSACPFCGGEVDPTGWLRGDGLRGPECDGCGATAPSMEVWEQRSHLADQIGNYPIGKGFLQEFFSAMKSSARTPEAKELIETAAGVVGALQRQVEGLAALAQPSPAPELEMPEVVGYRSGTSGGIYTDGYGLEKPEPLMTVAQHDRIIGVRAEAICLLADSVVRLRAERDAAQARVAELEGAARSLLPWMERANEKAHEDIPELLQLRAAVSGTSAPVDQAGQVPEALRSLLVRAQGQIEHLAECTENLGEDLEDDDVSEDVEEARALAEEIGNVLAAAPAQGGE